MSTLRLGVNIDHVATVRNARGERYPDPVARRRDGAWPPAPTASPPTCARTAATSPTPTSTRSATCAAAAAGR